MGTALSLVFGPVVATETLFNEYVELNEVWDRQERVRRWAGSVDGDLVSDDFGEVYFETPEDALRAIFDELRARLEDAAAAFCEGGRKGYEGYA